MPPLTKQPGTGSHHPHIQVVTYKNHWGTSAPALGFIGAKRRTLDGVSKSRHLINGRKASRCEPRKYEPAIKAKLFKVTRQDSSRRVAGRTDRVSAGRSGLRLAGPRLG